jgi:uncharacterized membrane protein
MTIVHHNLYSKKAIFYGFLAFYFAILTYLCIEVTLWEDECYTLNTTSRNLSEVISQSYHFEAQPPLYFILLKGWRQIYDGVFFARLFSLLFTVLAAYFFRKLASLISDEASLDWLSVIFLLNPFTVWAALEIRSYGLIIFIATISVYFFLRFLFNNEKKYLYFFLIFATIGLYTQYLFVFLIVSLLFSFLILRGWKSFLKLCINLLPVVILFLPNFLFISDNIAFQQTDNPSITWKNTLSTILQTPPNLLLGLDRVSFGNFGKVVFTLFSILLALYAYFILYKKHRELRDSFLTKINFILFTVLVFVLLYVFGFVLFRVQYADLYMAIVFPLFILLFTIFKVFSLSYMKLLYASLSLYFVFLLLLTYRYPIKFYDFKSIAKYVNEISSNNEPILFYRNGLSLPFGYYYKGNHLLCPLPKAVTFDKNYLINIKDTSDLRESIQHINTTSTTYILISDDRVGYLYTLNMNRKMVDDYLNNNYKTTLDTLCFGKSKNYYLRVRRIERIRNLL